MCGIAGLACASAALPDRAQLRAMADRLRHRGPDDQGFYLATGIGLGMRRLSIIDVQGGRQPISNEDGTVWVILNGEIYNFTALRPALERAGHRFATRSDTEVIVHAYEEYGLDFLKHLDGMFALAVWDAREQRLVLARDRLGKKPLYFAHLPHRLVFASEIKALMEDPDVHAEVDRD